MTAIFDSKRNYRYRLERDIQAEGIVAAVIMVNGSDADETKNDPTMKKVVGIGAQVGWRKVIVGNKFAAIGKDIKVLRGHHDPIGPENDAHLRQIIADGDMVVVGWGALAKLPEILRKRWIDIVRMADAAGKPLHCFGTNDDGHPTHPLMLAHATPIVPWQAPWFPNRGNGK